jgi:hypothetical protein
MKSRACFAFAVFFLGSCRCLLSYEDCTKSGLLLDENTCGDVGSACISALVEHGRLKRVTVACLMEIQPENLSAREVAALSLKEENFKALMTNPAFCKMVRRLADYPADYMKHIDSQCLASMSGFVFDSLGEGHFKKFNPEAFFGIALRHVIYFTKELFGALTEEFFMNLPELPPHPGTYTPYDSPYHPDPDRDRGPSSGQGHPRQFQSASGSVRSSNRDRDRDNRLRDSDSEHQIMEELYKKKIEGRGIPGPSTKSVVNDRGEPCKNYSECRNAIEALRRDSPCKIIKIHVSSLDEKVQKVYDAYCSKLFDSFHYSSSGSVRPYASLLALAATVSLVLLFVS